MFLTEVNKGVDELLSLVNQRAFQIIWLCVISMVLCQVIKFIIMSFRNKELMWHCLISTGGFPSSHTSTCITLTVSLLLFQLHDLDGKIDWSFAVAIIFSAIIIHDAMGVRLEASKHAKILNHLTSDLPPDEKQKIGFGKKVTLKEMLGHKGVEVLGGIILGAIIAVIGFFVLVNYV